jgi:hypothetical protein
MQVKRTQENNCNERRSMHSLIAEVQQCSQVLTWHCVVHSRQRLPLQPAANFAYQHTRMQTTAAETAKTNALGLSGTVAALFS